MANSATLVDIDPTYLPNGIGPIYEYEVVIDTINTDYTIRTASAGKRLYVVGLLLNQNTTANVILKSGTSKTRTVPLSLNAPMSGYLFYTKSGEDLKIQSSATSTSLIVRCIEAEKINADSVLSLGTGSGSGSSGSIPGNVVAEGTYNITAPVLADGASAPFQLDASGLLKVILQSNSGVDIGDVTINNAAGAPVPVQIGDGTSTIGIDTTSFDGRSATSNRVPTNAYLYAKNSSGTWTRLAVTSTNDLQTASKIWDGTSVMQMLTVGADATSNTKNTALCSVFQYGFNGTTWDMNRSGQVGVQTAFIGFNNVIPIGRYNASGITLADGNGAALQLHSTGDLKGLNKIWDGTTILGIDTGAAFDGRSNTSNRLPCDDYMYGFNGTTWDRLKASSGGVATTLTGILSTFATGRYVAAGITLADGNAAPAQMDSVGNIKTNIQSIAAPTVLGAFQLAVGTSSVQLTSLAVTQGVTIKADDDNTDSIYVGVATGVTTSTGYRLKAGQSVFVGCSNANLQWVISGAASQKIHVIGS